MSKSAPSVLWICSWFPNKEDKFRGDFIQRQAEALAGILEFELAHFVEYASQNELDCFHLNENCKVSIGYSKRRNKLLSFKAQWSFYNRVLKDYISRKGKPDLVHLHIPWKAGFVARYWLKKYKIPYIISEHYGIYNRITKENFFTKPRRVQNYYRKIYGSAKRVITVSKSLGDEIKKIFQTRYVSIPNAVDTKNFYFKNITEGETFSFLHISNMYGIKNTDKIIEAFSKAYETDKSLRLKLVGAKPQDITKQINQLECRDAISIEGEIDYEQVGETMKEHHVFVLFSNWETQSCVTLEALCSGRPVITSKVGGVQELINARNGLLVASGDIAKLTAAMLEMKNNYSQFHLEQIANDAQQKYSYEQVAKELMNTYRDTLGS